MGFKDEVRKGKRFEFGHNWRRFLSVLNDERIAEASKSLTEFLGVESLEGQSFLDVGSGSGLFSLVARRLGGRVHSFDYDPQSVACTATLRERYFGGDACWTVEAGSVLDEAYLDSLGRFDVVYAWGVLHHTGDMWRALDLVSKRVAAGGKLYIAIYNDDGAVSTHWLGIKRKYCALPRILRFPYAVRVWTPIEWDYFKHYWRNKCPGDYFKLWSDYKKARGMSRWHDMIDWLGGYPYEYSSAERLVAFYEARGFSLIRLV
ncbi:MAG: class I SAM-dependent methyltransferase, partial [Magnetospirillum sp.]|nr:class I SAM-dependent methyltransferase [Magnetospirillum sp.]